VFCNVGNGGDGKKSGCEEDGEMTNYEGLVDVDVNKMSS
jgi:hypothetical protein